MNFVSTVSDLTTNSCKHCGKKHDFLLHIYKDTTHIHFIALNTNKQSNNEETKQTKNRT